MTGSTHQTHLVLFRVACHGEQLSVMIEAKGRDWGGEVSDCFQDTRLVRFWSTFDVLIIDIDIAGPSTDTWQQTALRMPRTV